MPEREATIWIRVKEDMTAAMKRVDRSLGTLDAGVKRSSMAMGRMAKSVFSLKGALVGLGVGLIGREFLQTAESMEVYQAQMETALGSAEAAIEHLEWVKEFAAKTPYEISGLVEASVKLENYGIRSKEIMRTLGDTAGALGKDIGVAVEAIADAQTGEFERLKEFGIKSIQEAGETYFLYVDKHGKEQRALVDRNNREMITSTLTAIWNEKYEGGMERMSTTWRGMWSNMKDWFTQFQEAVMSSGLFAFLKTGLENFLGWLNQVKEQGQMDVWARNISIGIIDAFVAAGTVVAKFPELWFNVWAKIKGILAYVPNMIDTLIVAPIYHLTKVLSMLPGETGKMWATTRDDLALSRQVLQDISVDLLMQGHDLERSASDWENLGERAKASLEGAKKKAIETAAQLRDVSSASKPADSGEEEKPWTPATIDFEDDQEISVEDQAFFEKQMEQLREREERKLAILDEYRVRRMEAQGLEDEAARERMRQRHEQELEELRQLGASQIEIERAQAAQRIELERALQTEKTSAVAKGIQDVAKFFPKMKGMQLLEGIINAKGAIVKAWNSGPFPWNLGAVAAVAGNVWPLIKEMRSTGPGGGGASLGTTSAGTGTGGPLPTVTPAGASQESVQPTNVTNYHIHGTVFGDLDSAARAIKPHMDTAEADGVA